MTNTINKCWVCMVHGRFLISNGSCAWPSKNDAENAFKQSPTYKSFMVKINNKELKYNELIESGTVKYIEIEPIPNWVNI